MSSIPIPLVDGCFFIDNSALEYITTCPRSAEYYINRKREMARDRPALAFGGILHKILETRYREFPNSPITDDVKARMLQVALEAFQTYTPPEDDFRNYQTAVDFIDEYSQTYLTENFETVMLPSGDTMIPAIELPFAIPLFDYPVNSRISIRNPEGEVVDALIDKITVIWQGRIDRVFRHEGHLYGQDHKSTSMLGPIYFKEFELSSQFLGYTWALSHLLGQPVRGFNINALGIRKPTKTGKKLEFQRLTIEFSQEQLLEWHSETVDIITKYLTDCINGFLPRHKKWCVAKYGICQFFDVCTLPIAQRDLMLSTGQYKNVTWNPLHNE